MDLFPFQLVLIVSCVCENLEDVVVKLDSLVAKAVSDPKLHMEESLRENIGDLYMSLDDVLDRLRQGEEGARHAVDSIKARGGLQVSRLEQNYTAASETYNWTASQAEEVRQALAGTCHVWAHIDRLTAQTTTTPAIPDIHKLVML